MSAQVTTRSSGLRQGYWTFGLNTGFAYQSSDVKPLITDGWGIGLTLAKNLYYKPSHLLRFDLRGRLLYAQSYGADTKASGILNNEALNGTNRFGESSGINYTLPSEAGFVFANHKTRLGELGLEGAFMLNRLRERTKWVVTLYGGINFNPYLTKIDQLDGNSKTYSADYKAIGLNNTTSVNNLESIWDGTYETVADGYSSKYGRVSFTPSLGIEIGKEVLPHFIIGVGHKMNFFRNDVLDGQRWKINNTVTDKNDIHHYTNLQLLWEFNAYQKKVQPPIIEIVDPQANPYVTKDPRCSIIADIYNVNSAADVSFTVNESNMAFNFVKNKRLTRTIELRKGVNEVMITATNVAGRAEKKITIIYEEERVEQPEVVIVNPPYERYVVQESAFNVRAQVRNVTNKSDIEVFVNGSDRAFNFDSRTGNVTSDVRLVEGSNTIRVVAKNRVGSATASSSVVYEQRIIAPEVQFTYPSRNPFETSDPNITVRATIRNVEERNQVRFEINGYGQSGFNFNPSSGDWSYSMNLREGRNDLRLTADNKAGSASDNLTIYYRRIVTPPPPPPPPPPTEERPIVRIDDTGNPSSNGANCSTSIVASVRNVSGRDNIEFYVNGSRSSDFSYNAVRGIFNATIRLNTGRNTIRIVGKNRGGSAQDQATIEGCYVAPQQPKPVVTITEPNASNTNSSVNYATVKATVLNVNSSSDIQFIVNGRNQNFDYSTTTKVLRASINLNDGSNMVKIVATNPSGSDDASVNIKYLIAPKVMKPIVKIEQPANGSTTTNVTVDFRGKAENIGSNDVLTLSINGRNIDNFTFNKISRVVTTRLNLQDGVNTIRLFGKNEAGQDEAVTTVTKAEVPKPIEKPILTFVKPATSGTTVEVAQNEIVVAFKNINSINDVEMFLNNNPVRFRFDNVAKTISARLNMKEGENRIVVNGKNEAGTASAETRIIYKAKVTQKPVVEITSVSTPVSSPRRPDVGSSTLLGKIQYATKEQITLTINGNVVTNWNFDSTSGQISCSFNLVKGVNTIVLKATNAAGTDEKSTTVNF